MTLIGRGYASRVEDAEKPHDDLPSQNIITRVSGPGPFDVVITRVSRPGTSDVCHYTYQWARCV